MSFLTNLIKDAAVGDGIADDPVSLRTVLHPGRAAAIWRRRTTPETQTWQDDLLRLRHEALTKKVCRKPHIDMHTALLNCTCSGTGSQYGVSADGNEPKRVFTVQTGAPILLRDKNCPAELLPELMRSAT